MGDYQGYGDNQVPGGVTEGVWETVGTTNESWGYKPSDQNWKSPELIIKLLTNIVSKGGVYLLNVGPDAKGNLPQPAVHSLKAVGQWLQTNGEAVYDAGPSPFIKEFNWGAITTRPG
jgi:alpha-L-fucosidase